MCAFRHAISLVPAGFLVKDVSEMSRERASYRMSYPWPIWVPCLVMIVASIVAGSIFPFFLKMRSAAGNAHTGLLMNQIGEILQEPPAVDSKGQLIERLKAACIDWNSCRINGDEIIDSWKSLVMI